MLPLYRQDLSFSVLGISLGVVGVFAPGIICDALGAQSALSYVQVGVAAVILGPYGWKVATGLRREMARRAAA